MAKVFDEKALPRLDSPERRKLIPPLKVLRLMNLEAGDVLLDLGAGTGYFAIPALEFVSSRGRVIAADISPKMIETLKKRAPKGISNLEILQVESDKIPVEDDSVDKVLLAFVFHELPDQHKYLEIIDRVLKTEGQLTIVEWLPVSSPMGPPLKDRIDPDKLQKIMYTSSFRLLSRYELNPYQYLTNWHKNQL